MTDERIAAVRDVGEIVKTERVALVADMDRISEKAVDQAFWRATQLSAAFALAALIAVVALLFLARRLFANHPPADRRE